LGAEHRNGNPSEEVVLNHSPEPGEPGIDKPSVIEALRKATRPLHANLGASPAMSRLFASDYTTSEYRAHLGRLLGFFEPLETAASRLDNTEASSLVVQRSIDLREDLRIMGATARDVDSLERCLTPPLISQAGLRGYTYVILGSTLGAKLIVKQLRSVLGPDASFRFYGDEDGRYQEAWASFRLDLEENGRNDVDAICETAAGVFDAYAAWFSDPRLRIGGE
jgi:heme oxygenase